MKHWTVKQRITTGFATVLLLLTALSVTSILLLRQVAVNIQDVLEDALPGTTVASKIKCAIADEHLAVWRSIIARTDADRKSQQATIASDVALVSRLMVAYEPTIKTETDRRNFDQLTRALADYAVPRQRMVDFGTVGASLDTVYAYNTATFHPAHAALDAALDALFDFNEASGHRSGASSQAALGRARAVILAGSGIAVAAGLAFAVLITLGLTRALRRVADELDDGSDQVAAASTQVAATSQTLASGISEQAAALEETSASLEEMSSLTKRNAENAQTAKELSTATRQAADSGSGEVDKLSTAMNAIKSSSDNIARIIKTIDEIAFQTNILALNAAVEAARAGDAGMGFAVVADEVRSLAQRSAQAARETAEKIEDSITKSEHGVRISVGVCTSFQEIVAKARQVDELLGQIATASKEQSQGIDEVNRAVAEMDKVTQSGAAGAEESASAAEELKAQAKSLKDVVTRLLRLSGGRAAAGPVRPPAEEPARPSQAFTIRRPTLPPPARRAMPAPLAARTAATAAAASDDFTDF